MSDKTDQMITELLKGAYDLHMHAAPSPFARVKDDFELLKEADDAGMAGIMLKSHYESTSARAQIANTHAGTKAKAYGGLVLNHPVGGLNPFAAVNAAIRGCKIIWMPTRDAANSLVSGNMPGDFFEREGISILSAGKLKPEIHEIFSIAKQYDVCVATGHVSPEESVMMCREGRAQGVRMVLTHPEFSRTKIDGKTQKELADLGVYIEKCWYNVAENECTPEEMVQHIRTVGAERCFMTTDRGQKNRETPVEGLKRFMKTLSEAGITKDEIYLMTHDVPARVLGIENTLL